MAKSAWQRTGAFVGTVTAVALVAKTVSPRSSTRVIEGMGKAFSSSLGAMTGKDMSVADYQRGGYPVIDGRLTNVLPPMTLPAKPIPYFWNGIYYRLLSLFPQVAMPYEVDWHRWVELVHGEEWEDASLDWAGIEHFGNLVGELRESYESW